MAIPAAMLSQIAPLLDPVLEKIIQKAKKELRENFVFLSWWNKHPNFYVYHIDPQLRKSMYSYLKTTDVLKRTGLAFGNELIVGKIRQNNGFNKYVVDIGFYGFVPFYNIARYYGSEKADGKTVAEICAALEKLLANRKVAGDKITLLTRTLTRFVLERCTDENFPKLLVKGSDDFAKAYMEIYKESHASNYGGRDFRTHVLSRFLKASFHGVYINSTGFVGLTFSTNPEEFLNQAGEIASKIGKEPFKMVTGFRKLRVIDKLVAVFEPDAKEETIMTAIGGMPSINVIMTDKIRLQKILYLLSSFRSYMWYFDTEMRTKHDIKGLPYPTRIPTILNMFVDKNAGYLRSVCAGYNNINNSIQQIKFGKVRGRAFTRCKNIANIYQVKDTSHLPSEVNHHSAPKPHSD